RIAGDRELGERDEGAAERARARDAVHDHADVGLEVADRGVDLRQTDAEQLHGPIVLGCAERPPAIIGGDASENPVAALDAPARRPSRNVPEVWTARPDPLDVTPRRADVDRYADLGLRRVPGHRGAAGARARPRTRGTGSSRRARSAPAVV